MNIIESLRKVESRIFADRNESVNLVDMYLTNSKHIDKAKLQEMLENNNTNGVIKLLNRANRKSLKEDYYTVKYYYYTDDNQIEEDGHTFDNAQDAKAFSDSVKSGLKNNLISLDWDIHDENMTRDWELLDRKTIKDYDGFDTDYSLWKKIDEDYWVCVFGDSDIYGPEDGEFDAEFDTEREAKEWFDNYSGFEDELDENLSLKEGKRNGKFQTVYWLVTCGRFIHGPRRSYNWGVNDESELFWYNIEDGYKTLSSAKNAAKRMMEKSDDDVVIKEYQIEFEDDLTTRKVDAEEISSIKIKNPNRTYPHPEEIQEALFDAGVRTRLYSTRSDGSSLIVTVYLSEQISYSNEQEKGYYHDYSETADKIIKVLKDNFNVQELGVETTKKKQKFDNLDRDDRYQELKFAKYAVTYKDDGIDELDESFDSILDMVKRKTEDFSLRNGFITCDTDEEKDSVVKLLKRYYDDVESEAEVFNGENYYNVFFADPSWEQVVDESLKESSIVQSVNSFRRMLDRFNENGKSAKSGDWSIAKGGYDLDFEVYHKGVPVIDCVNGELEVLTDRQKYLPIAKTITNIYKDTHLSESLKEYIDSTILSDQTLSLLEEGDHLVNGNEGWQILEIEVRGNRYLPNRERVWLDLIGKNGIKKYTSAGTLYGYKIVEKSKAPKNINAYDRDSNVLGENLNEDWDDYMLSDDELEEYKDPSYEKDFLGLCYPSDVTSVKELFPEISDEDAKMLEETADYEDAFIYKTEDGKVIYNPLADDYAGWKDVKHFVEDMWYGYNEWQKDMQTFESLNKKSVKEDWEDENHGTSDKKASMERVEKFVDLVGGDLKSTKDGGAIITWDGGKIVAKGLQDLFNKVEKAYKKMQK